MVVQKFGSQLVHTHYSHIVVLSDERDLRIGTRLLVTDNCYCGSVVRQLPQQIIQQLVVLAYDNYSVRHDVLYHYFRVFFFDLETYVANVVRN